MHHSTLLLLATEKAGGLFDLDGTLPLMGIQFLALMFLLNSIMYTPLLELINERNTYITENLFTSTTLLAQATEIMTQYEIELAKARKEAQVEISTLQKIYKNIVETETKLSQKTVDGFLIKVLNSFQVKKDNVFSNLENEIDSLSTQIISKLLA